MTIWEILGIEETDNMAEIKKAYADKIKKHRPETDPEGFQLAREAYEAARKFAAGETISCEIDNLPLEETESEAPSLTPQDLVFYLLDLLRHQEQEALQKFKEMHNKGLLDNLEFSENFQELIALRLTDKAQDAPEFTSFLIQYFCWHNHPAIHSESLFGIALRTLIKQTAWYRFYQELKAKSLLSKAQAKEQNLDWNYCWAIKKLLRNKKPQMLALWWIFSRKKRKAIACLLAETDSYRFIDRSCGLEEHTLFWRENYDNTKLKLRFGFSTILFLAYCIVVLVKHGKIDFSATNTSAQKVQSQPANIQNILQSSSTNIVLTFSEHAGKKLHGENHYILHIPPLKNAANEEVFWNIMLFDKEHRELLKNPFNNTTLGLNNYQPVFKNKDGSVDIYLQPSRPSKTEEKNCLLIPGDNFIVTAQFYWKKNADVISRWDGIKLTEITGSQSTEQKKS